MFQSGISQNAMLQVSSRRMVERRAHRFNEVGVISPCNVRMGAQAAFQIILSNVAKQWIIRIALRAARLCREFTWQR
jgi:hypothetical protein